MGEALMELLAPPLLLGHLGVNYNRDHPFTLLSKKTEPRAKNLSGLPTWVAANQALVSSTVAGSWDGIGILTQDTGAPSAGLKNYAILPAPQIKFKTE